LIWNILLAFGVRAPFAGTWELGILGEWPHFFLWVSKDIASGNGVLRASRVSLYPMFLAAVTFGHQVFLPSLSPKALSGLGSGPMVMQGHPEY
jgi:hypothetical protein